jgi:hypothetical protein
MTTKRADSIRRTRLIKQFRAIYPEGGNLIDAPAYDRAMQLLENQKDAKHEHAGQLLGTLIDLRSDSTRLRIK